MEQHLDKYKSFFKHFLSLVNPADQLPVKITICNIKKLEVIGSILDWILQYLKSWNCPDSLITPLAKIILDEVKPILKTSECPYYSQELEVYSSLQLMQYVISKIQEICPRYLEDEQILSLSVPNQEHYISVFATKNRRRYMEDCHVIIRDLQKLFNIKDIGCINYYAIFDGHNGSGAAAYAAAHLHQFLAESPFYPMHPEQALCEAFKATDKHLLEKEDSQMAKSGTTAVCILWHQTEKMLYSAWVGDSEAILVKKGHIFRLVEPHKANRTDEQDRIKNMGGAVIFWCTVWRVNGQLAITRAIGDSEHKSCIISTPDVGSLQLEGDEDFIILACDGLWDCVEYTEAAQLVYEHVVSSPDNYDQVSQLLVKLAKTKGSEDNISIIVIYLTDPHHIKLPSIDMETVTAESFSPKQNGANYCSINDIQGNFNRGVNDDDDFGPETNVDNIDDGLISQPVPTKKSFTSFDALNTSTFEQETCTSSETKESENLENDKNTVSDESDEEEWNYFKGDENTNSKSNNCDNSPESMEINVSSNEMDYTLNPDAAEFVPLSPTSVKKENLFDVDEPILKNVTPEVRQRLLCDEIVASSPLKGQEKSMENVDLPSLTDFDSEIKKRPSNIFPTNELDTFDVDTHTEKNDENQLPVAQSFNAPSLDSSTDAIIGDDSSYVKNLDDLSSIGSTEKLNETFEKETIRVDSTTNSQVETVVENGLLDDEKFSIINEHVIDSKKEAHEEYSVHDFNESFIESSEKSSFKNFSLEDTVNTLQNMASFDDGAPAHSLIFSDNETVLKFNSKSHSPVDELLEEQKFNGSASTFANFDNSINPFLSVSNEETFSTPSNKSIFDAEPEKENLEEKEITDYVGREETDVIDFIVRTPENEVAKHSSEESLNFIQQKQSNHDDLFPNDDETVDEILTKYSEDKEENCCVKELKYEDVEVKPEVEKYESCTLASHENVSTILEDEKTKENEIEDIDNIERSLSSQIEITGDFESHKFSAEAVDRLEDVTVLSDAGSSDEPIKSIDMETPYIHDCTRLDEKPDSVHHHTTHAKHYDDLLPDVSSTMESNKLELELRESDFDKRSNSVDDEVHNEISDSIIEPASTEIKVEGVISSLQIDDQIEQNEVNQTSDIVVSDRTTVEQQESNDNQLNEVTAVAAATAVGIAAAVAINSVITNDDVKETKKSSVIKKPPEEIGKSSLKTTKVTSTSNKTTKTSSATTKSSSEPKKLTTTIAASNKATPSKSNTSTLRTATSKTTTFTSKSTVAAKSTAVAKDKPTTAATTTARSPAKVNLLAKPKTLPSQTTKPLNKSELSNGNISSSKLIAARRVSTTMGTMRKSTTPSETTSTTKPAVNLITRTSLAPKPKTNVEKPKLSTTLLTAKRPTSASVKVTNKDTKDITNKRLSATKNSPLKMNSSPTYKTESKVNSGLKGTVSSSMSATKKSTSVVNENQSEIA